MFAFRPYLAVIAVALVTASCAIKDLKDDLDIVVEDYGYLKGQVMGPDDGSSVLIAVFTNEQGTLSMFQARTVNSDEPFYVLLPRADYTLIAVADSNGDFAYQKGESAARIDNPTVNWFSDMQGQDQVDYDALSIQQIELASSTVLDRQIDLSVAALREENKIAKNFLKTVSFDDDAFSSENMVLGMWRPGAFQEQVGYGLYVLEEFDPNKKTILLVHGINDTPRIFENFVRSIPADYQLLLFHYPSAFPLEYTSYILNEALDEVIRRYQLPELNVIAHSMGGLVSKGMIYQADEVLRQRMRVFISMATPFGGHTAAAAGLKWSPVIAPVWWAMAPGSSYLQTIDGIDLTDGPNHHLMYSYSHEKGGEREKDDGVVTVESQLVESARRNATAVYGIDDNHVGIVSNACTLAMVPAILQDSASAVKIASC